MKIGTSDKLRFLLHSPLGCYPHVAPDIMCPSCVEHSRYTIYSRISVVEVYEERCLIELFHVLRTRQQKNVTDNYVYKEDATLADSALNLISFEILPRYRAHDILRHYVALIIAISYSTERPSHPGHTRYTLCSRC